MKTIIAGLLLLCSCADTSSEAEKTNSHLRISSLSEQDMERICSPIRAAGDIECQQEDGVITFTDRFDSERCMQLLSSLQQEIGCLEVTEFEAWINGDACNRGDCEFTCPGAEQCDSLSIDDCQPLSDDACRVYSGFVPNSSGTCLIEQPAYCGATTYGCDASIHSMIDPTGICWMFPSSCPTPSNWSEATSCGGVEGLEPCQ
jgi:hypothetical protein